VKLRDGLAQNFAPAVCVGEGTDGSCRPEASQASDGYARTGHLSRDVSPGARGSPEPGGANLLRGPASNGNREWCAIQLPNNAVRACPPLHNLQM
jgi:hypothetical protein